MITQNVSALNVLVTHVTVQRKIPAVAKKEDYPNSVEVKFLQHEEDFLTKNGWCSCYECDKIFFNISKLKTHLDECPLNRINKKDI